ncbi:MAG: isochorismatase family protein [Candidatus Babeliales bacterium]
MQTGKYRLSVDNAVLLLVDHQTGLFQLVRDYSPDEFKNNVCVLAAIGKMYNLPTILTTSFESGPNGPLFPEIRTLHPHATFIARPGEINAWDNKDFVDAVKATGRKKLLIAGIVTDVCVALPTLAALAEGFDVYVVADACGTTSVAVRELALMRMVHAGAVITNWFAVSSELHRDWRHNGEALAALLGQYFVPYANLMSSYKAKK